MRLAVGADAEPMRALVRRAFEVYLPRMGREPMPMLHDFPALIERGECWLAEDGDGLAGALVLEPLDGHLLLDTIAVAPERQGTGLGGELLRFVEQRARALGRPEIRLYTNELMTENIAYYPRKGYTETHRGGQDGFRRVFFTKAVLPR